MFPVKRALPVALIVLLLNLPVPGRANAADIDRSLDACNVTWDIPGPTSWQSMPIGNGDIGLNVWVEPDGSVAFYIGKTDAWGEDNYGSEGLMKVGGVHISMSPGALGPGAPFAQVLKLHEGEIEIREGTGADAVVLHIWVDANHPVIRVEAKSEKPVAYKVTLDDWRAAPAGGANPDVILTNQINRIEWYHRNRASADSHVANLTFGAVIEGDGLVNADARTLQSAAPTKSQLISIHPMTATTPAPDEWLALMDQQVDGNDRLNLEKTWRQHKQWWDQFWHRSWVFVRGDAAATNVTEGFVLQRFVTACAGRGAYPIKFNGSLFVVDDPYKHHDADFRVWGGQYWFQNTRAMYWPRLMAGDFDMMLPLFRMYARMLPANAAQVKGYYGHDGAYFAETAPFWGGLKYMGPEVKENWTGHYFTPVLELSMMMLDYYEYTGDQQFARETLLPVASAGLEFFNKHFARDDQGKILLDPDNSIEMFWKVHDPAPDIAGLHAVLARLIALPDDVVDASTREGWKKMEAGLPDLPIGTVNGRHVLLPYTGEQKARPRNGENPELYAIYPFRLYGLEQPDLQLALDTFNARKQKQKGCWVQDPIQAAMLGLAGVARDYVTFNLERKEPSFKFPAFWAKGNDYAPDEDNGGNGENGLQQMLLQAVGRKILLLPAWPAEWSADFKLHAPFQTTVQGRIEHGLLTNLVVIPPDRMADVVVMAGQPASSEATTESAPVRVACIGDSIVYGAGVEHRERNNWPAVLGRWLGGGWDVRNFGINSATMLKHGDFPYWNQKVYTEALAFKPDVVIISLGANDTKHPTDAVKDAVNNWQYKADFTNDYEEMIASFKRANPAVKIYVCLPLPAYPGQWGISDTTIREEVIPMIGQVANATGATVIDLYTALSGKRELFPDTVHPNAAGAKLVAAAVHRALTGREPTDIAVPETVPMASNITVRSILSPGDAIVPLQQTTRGQPNTLAESGEFGGDGDAERVANAIDGNVNTKYFNKSEDSPNAPGIDSGLAVTPASGPSVVSTIQFAAANDMPDRDPVTITLEGSNDPKAGKDQGNGFVLIYKGPSGLDPDPGRNQWGRGIQFTNTTSYKTYRILIMATRQDTDAAQYSEVKLGTAVEGVVPASN